mmetsp:Transcript_13414/g.42162  ORF Transcript_13414/g.42162 Transcript_13414/m.42162 type:complete len:309 (-) Transcript_13414:99-1025(-)
MNWPGLLAWSTKYHDGTKPSKFKPMTDEDREFLERAMEEAFGQIEDPNQVMKEAIEKITAPDRTDEAIATALEVLDKCVDDVDCARNAEKLNGVQSLLDLLGTHEGPIRVRTLEILALLFSNNPTIQEAGVKRGAMKTLIRLTQECPKPSEERSKAFRALVALVRQAAVFEDAFLRGAGGMGVLLGFLELSEDARTREKAASFARSLAGDGRLQADEAAALVRAVVPLFAGLAGESMQYREMIAECTHELASAVPAQCTQPLKAAVRERLDQLQAAKDPETETEQQALTQCLIAFAAAGGTAAAPPAA